MNDITDVNQVSTSEYVDVPVAHGVSEGYAAKWGFVRAKLAAAVDAPASKGVMISFPGAKVSTLRYAVHRFSGEFPNYRFRCYTTVQKDGIIVVARQRNTGDVGNAE